MMKTSILPKVPLLLFVAAPVACSSSDEAPAGDTPLAEEVAFRSVNGDTMRGGRLYDRFYGESPGAFSPDDDATPGIADGEGGPYGNGTLVDGDGFLVTNDLGHDFRVKNFFGWDLRGAEGVYGPTYQDKDYVLPYNLIHDSMDRLDVAELLVNGSSGAPAFGAAMPERDLADLVERRMYPDLVPVERDLRYLLDSWFNRGFLRLERLDWRTPAHILESLIRFEAVHEIRGWPDLRRRLAADRRTFGFFHPALPDEPIIFVEVALQKGLAESIPEVIDAPVPSDHGSIPRQADTAIFYAITNCQAGLRGISFGSFLIKQVTERLSAELPQIDTFATLSPIPGFAEWLLDHHGGIDTTDRHAMETACAEYLVGARRGGLPADPVARFHLRNGACVERINWQGDLSDKGRAESHGMLVNYMYSGQDLADNHEALTVDGVVTASPSVLGQVGTSVPPDRYRVRGPSRS